ncbi:hypothetical protein TWF696_001534 [Orbilia brochopaga]|uniref:Ser-Thr-rich glycosyl-phosphatidyl-inositol-anchored membrane family-domain-containing protein n=1 Tax=Orbilia brochopaga TaxID=3140254 RepID=A0AAV9U984_9PEZI
MKAGLSIAFALLQLAVVNAGVIPRQITPMAVFNSGPLRPGSDFGLNGDELWVNFKTPTNCDHAELHWAVGNAWAKTPILPEAEPELHASDNTKYWRMRGNVTDGTQFYIKATCDGKDIYAPGNGANFPMPLKFVVPNIIARDYGLNGNHLYGEFLIPYNCDPVNIFWAKGTEFQDAPVAAELRFPAIESYYAIWGVEAETPGATQFYIKASCDGKELISPGNFVNYQLKA